MNFKQFKYVLVLSREGSFSRAAEELGISQPSLSQYIKKIEGEVGLPLFNRAGSDVRLTDAGRVYIDAGQKILDLEHQMSAKFLDLAENKSGSVVIGTSPFRSAAMMPTVARELSGMYPGMHLVVEERQTHELIEGMEHGEFDFCILMLPVDERVFVYEKVMEEELILAVPASCAPFDTVTMEDRKYPAVDAACIDGAPFVMITEAQVMQVALNRLCEVHDVHPRCAAVVKSLEALIAMVRAGVGMALVPTGIERFCAGDEVRFYSFVQPLPRREVIAMWRRDRHLSEVSRALIQKIKSINW